MSSLTSWIMPDKDDNLEHVSLLLRQLIDKHDKLSIYQSKRLLASCMRKGSPYTRGGAWHLSSSHYACSSLPPDICLTYLKGLPDYWGGVPHGEPGLGLLGGRASTPRLHPAWQTPNPPASPPHAPAHRLSLLLLYPPPTPTPANEGGGNPS